MGRPLADVSCGDGVHHPGLQGPGIGPGERLIEAHDRWAWRGHDLVVCVVVGDRRLRGGHDGVGQVRPTGVGVGLLPAQLSSVVHRRVLPVRGSQGRMWCRSMLFT